MCEADVTFKQVYKVPISFISMRSSLLQADGKFSCSY
jgi:hypothetical protein